MHGDAQLKEHGAVGSQHGRHMYYLNCSALLGEVKPEKPPWYIHTMEHSLFS